MATSWCRSRCSLSSSELMDRLRGRGTAIVEANSGRCGALYKEEERMKQQQMKAQKGYTLLEYCAGAAIIAGILWTGLNSLG